MVLIDVSLELMPVNTFVMYSFVWNAFGLKFPLIATVVYSWGIIITVLTLNKVFYERFFFF